MVAYARATNGVLDINAWAGNLVVGAAEPRPYYFNFCLTPCQSSTWGCETAYANGGNLAFCFDTFGFKNWGWTNGLISAGDDIIMDLWAGAGQCDVTKGTHVGYFEINYNGSVATITYSLFNGFIFDETHVYVGNDPLPKKKNGSYTVAPGQYPYKHENINGASTDTYIISGLSGDINVIGHGVVSGFYPDAMDKQ